MTFPSKADAAEYLSTVQADMLRGAWVDPRLARVTLGEWVERWRELTPGLRPTTQDLYDYLLRRFLLPTFKRVPLGDIDTLAVRRWLATLARDAKVSESTRAKAYRLLARILALAVESGYLLRNPCTIKGAGTERPPEMRIASVEQVGRLADEVPEPYRALVLVAAYGGLRWGELVGLRVEHVDQEVSRLRVVEQVTEVNGRFLVGPPKTEAGKRRITLPRIAGAALTAHVDRFSEAGERGLVFPSPEGGYLRRSNFRRRAWLPATRAVGVEGLRFHDLRHTAATFALTAGANSRELMARIGHASSAAAMRYQHVMEGRDQAIAAALDAFVAAQPTTATGTRMARTGPAEGSEDDG